MSPQSPQRWSVATWLRDWVSRDCREGWRESSQLPLGSWRRWFDYDHTIWLVYLGFWFIQPYLDHEPLIKWVWLLLALALFIPFYLLAHRGPRRVSLGLGARYVCPGRGLCADQPGRLRSLHLCSGPQSRRYPNRQTP